MSQETTELTSAPSGRRLQDGFLRSVERYPQRPALEVEGRTLSYADLFDRAASLAATLTRHTPAGGPALTAVLAYRSATAFAGVLSALLRGHGYVPLNPNFPAARTALMLERSGCRAIVVDRAGYEGLDAVLEHVDEPLLIVLPDHGDASEARRRWPQHTVVDGSGLTPASAVNGAAEQEQTIAYVLFTSGSTGVPKGVMVAPENVRHFVSVMVDRYGITETDRFSQTFDMTFDLSVFDMFVAWDRGACVCCLPEAELIKPGRFIQEAGLTVWFSVPSTGLFMRRLGMLKPDRYPTLRWSLFCGEPLPMDVAGEWSQAAPNSIVENLYGPTEITIACMFYRWDASRSPDECRFGIVPIGEAYPGMTPLVADAELQEVAVGAEGELLMTGPQVSRGYIHDEEKTAAAFVVPPGRHDLYYRTGDLVLRPDTNEPMVYLGRIDNQVKVGGHRVELGEIEEALREASGVDAVVALGWPRTEAGAAAITAFVGASDVNVDAVRRQVSERLPSYMVPRRIHAIAEIPLNANGKFDRKALVTLLEDGAA